MTKIVIHVQSWRFKECLTKVRIKKIHWKATRLLPLFYFLTTVLLSGGDLHRGMYVEAISLLPPLSVSQGIKLKSLDFT